MCAIRAFLCVMCLASIGGSAQAVIVLEDDFADGVIDTNKWMTNTTAPSSSVVEETGRMRFLNRGFLIDPLPKS